MSFLEISKLCVSYNGTECISELDLSVEKGEIIVILGPSGCGKSTLLKAVSGLMRQDFGTISIDGEDMLSTIPEKRPVSMVFQKPLLFRNMTVEKNVNYAPRLLGTIKGEDLAQETEKLLGIVGLSGYGGRKANELSGGQEQRVSLARALITKPKILLLDEPLSALDAELRVSMRRSIRDICKSLGQTVIFVTHDQEEAVSIADRIALMSNGKIIQCSEPSEFYRRPKTAEVARFFGWKNFVQCEWNGEAAISCLGTIHVSGADVPEGERLMVIRPESIHEDEYGSCSAIVVEAGFMGTHMDYILDVDGTRLYASMGTGMMHKAGDVIKVSLDPSGVWIVDRICDTPEPAASPARKKGLISRLFGR